MKNKYERMTKAEKEKIKEKYSKTEKGQMMMKRLNRVCFIGIFGILLAIVLIVFANNIWEYVNSSVLLVVSIFFLIKSHRLKIKVLNDEALKQK